MRLSRSLIFFLWVSTWGCGPTGAEPPATPPAPRMVRASYSPPETVPDLGTRSVGEDWPWFLGLSGNNRSRETNINLDWPAEGPPIVWQHRLAEGYGMPTVSRGRLFQFHRTRNEARLTCLHNETGEVLWETTYPTSYQDFYGYNNGPRTSPVVDRDRVYTFGVEGMLQCRSVLDGELIWSIDTTEQFGVVQNFFGVGSTPVVEDHLLIVQIGGSPPGSPDVRSGRVEGNGSGIVAFDKFTGETIYQITDELASYASPTLATIGDRRWCFMFTRGGLVGFEPKSGQVDFFYPWRASIIESVNASTPVVAGNEVFISEAYDLAKGSSLLRAKPGGYEVVWKDEPRSRKKAMQTHFNTPVYVDGYLYGSSARHSADAELRCVEWSTGQIQWSVPGLGWSSLLYVAGHFICLSENGTLRVLIANPEKYELVREVVLSRPDDLGGTTRVTLLRPPCWAAPILSHGYLYVRGRDRLVCLDIRDEAAGAR